jgi:SAM-dependent methyltransferase
MEDSNKRFWSRFIQDAMENSPEFLEAFNKEKQLFRKLASKGELGECVTVMCCGDGREVDLLLDLQREFPQLKEVHAVDLLPVSVNQVREKVREKIRQLDAVNIHVLQEDATDTSIAPNSQDTVTCMLTMVNFNDETIAKFLKHVEYILKPGGKFICSVYNDDAFAARMKLYRKVDAPIESADSESGFVVFGKDFEEAAFSRQFQHRQFQRLVKNSGLNVRSYNGKGITHLGVLEKPEPLYDCRRIPLFRRMVVAASVAAVFGLSVAKRENDGKEHPAYDKDTKLTEIAPGVFQRVNFKRKKE